MPPHHKATVQLLSHRERRRHKAVRRFPDANQAGRSREEHVYLKMDPAIDALRGDSRFAGLLHRIRF
jgi:hypothetical protein